MNEITAETINVHVPAGRVVHAALFLERVLVTLCGHGMGLDYTKADHLPVTCSRCKAAIDKGVRRG